MSTDLDFLIGRFAGADHVYASVWAEADEAATTAEGHADVAGTVLLRLVETRTAGDRFEVLHVFVRDRGSGDVLLYAFDSVGYPPDPPARGRWVGTDLVLDRATSRGRSRTVFAPTSAGFRWRKHFRATDADQWQDVVAGELIAQV